MTQHIDLFNSNRTIFNFDILGLISGISTRSLGNFVATSENVKKRIGFINDYCSTDYFNMIMPIHDVSVVEAKQEKSYNFIPGSDSIVFYDRTSEKLLALIHCSWKTTSMGIIDLTLKKINELKIFRSVSLNAFIYPGICQNCYEVEQDVRKKFDLVTHEPYFKRLNDKKWLFDLSGSIRQILLDNNFDDHRIRTLTTCSAHSVVHFNGSASSEIFFSHRAKKDKERNLVFAKLANSPVLLGGTSGDCPYVIVWST